MENLSKDILIIHSTNIIFCEINCNKLVKLDNIQDDCYSEVTVYVGVALI